MRKSKPWLIGAGVSGLLILILGYIVAGIIGNGSYALLSWLWVSVLIPLGKQIPKVIKLVMMSSWWLPYHFCAIISQLSSRTALAALQVYLVLSVHVSLANNATDAYLLSYITAAHFYLSTSPTHPTIYLTPPIHFI